MAYKQHFVEWFSGKQLPSYWTTGIVVGSPTFAMSDSVDGGFQISCPNSANGLGYIHFNNKRHYSATDSTSISVFKGSKTSANSNFQTGINSTSGNGNASLSGYHTSYSTTYFVLITGDGSISTTNTDVTADTSFHVHKIVNGSANIKLYLDGVLKVTKTTNRPTGSQQPYAEAQAWGTTGAVNLNMIYLEAYNT